MRLLVLYKNCKAMERKTVSDHLFSFEKYLPNASVHYCEFYKKIPSYLQKVKWNGIILHYTLLVERMNPPFWKYLIKNLTVLKKFSGVKIALPQDEYAHTADLWDLFNTIGVDTVFTCAYESEYDKLYPPKICPQLKRVTTLTGFVDEKTLSIIKELQKTISKPTIDIGYRARDLPYWIGKHGQLKKEIALLAQSSPYSSKLTLDISTEAKDVFQGTEWIKFLLRCHTTLGCLGGSSLLDPNGLIREKVENFLQNNPQATFKETKEACFKEEEGNLALFALSPRHFECAMTKTCQILVEGDYGEILQPNIHYIELKKDFSNYEEITKKIQDRDYCAQIAENAYCDLVESKRFTYQVFAESILKEIPNKNSQGSSSILSFILNLRKKFHPIREFSFKVWYKLFFLKQLPTRTTFTKRLKFLN